MWVPPSVSRELVAERDQFNAELREIAALGHMKGMMDEFNHELRRIDTHLQLIFVPEGADTGTTPCKAGYYHVIRQCPGAPDSVIVVQGEHGEPVEPTSRLFDKLKQGDLWDARNMRVLRQRERLADEAAERQKIREREGRQQELVERVAAVTRAQVSMNRSIPWSQNHAGGRAAKAAAKSRDKAA